ncbi:helix-turn-helix domain-containing protein [Aliikangiella marina]|uniref:helix-turn-helix domain-containing protein n=1 Tax=Aliikangiella marina TaxID=1712262 RepID=UPI00163D70C4|nr:helix-turn-helix transcriptional regulator [Aliikangiella marina]
MKSLRLSKGWSQDQLAQMSGLNVRTIQRVEKGDTVGAETLKSLASVFEISTEELLQRIEAEKEPKSITETEQVQIDSNREQIEKRVDGIKYFYAFSAFLITVFVLFMLPNYNEGENTGPLIVVFLSFAVLIGGLAIVVYQPFGEQWKKKKVEQILKQQSSHDQGSAD